MTDEEVEERLEAFGGEFRALCEKHRVILQDLHKVSVYLIPDGREPFELYRLDTTWHIGLAEAWMLKPLPCAPPDPNAADYGKRR